MSMPHRTTSTPDAQGLSEGQKTCLRLVGRGMSSKEIAIATGWSPQTVDTYVKAAMARLGVSNRRVAARLLEEAELSPKMGSPAEPVVAPVEVAEPGDVADRGAAARWLMPPPVGGRANDLTPREKVYAVLRVSTISSIVVVALMLLIAGAMRTFR